MAPAPAGYDDVEDLDMDEYPYPINGGAGGSKELGGNKDLGQQGEVAPTAGMLLLTGR